MAEAQKKSKGGSKLSRSEITTVRLDPKLRYLAELAARKQRRTLSSFIEWAIEDTLGRFLLKDGVDWVESVGAQAEYLWDVDPADRFAKLALRYPELLTHDEQVLWKLIRENGALWKGRFAKGSKEWEWMFWSKNCFSLGCVSISLASWRLLPASSQPQFFLGGTRTRQSKWPPTSMSWISTSLNSPSPDPTTKLS